MDRIEENAAVEGSTGEQVAEATGGIGGVVAGATIGSLAGPIGTLVGGLAGAIGGWWAGRSVADMFNDMTDEDDDFYRMLYEASPYRLDDLDYDTVKPAYQIGHVAGLNPDYTGREFEEIEPDLRAVWTYELTAKHGSWDAVSPLAKDAYTRGRAPYRRPTVTP